MDMTGERRIEAPRETVWAALNDPEILRRSIPGCQEIEKRSETEMTAVAVIKVGPVSARFQGAVTLSDLDPPNGYRITGEGQGGVAGFAKGTATIRLEEAGDATILRYEVSAQIGGKLAQLGGRLIDATARKMTDAFFSRFADEIAAGSASGTPSVAEAAGRATAGPPPTGQQHARTARIDHTSPSAPAASAPSTWLHIATLAIVAAALVWSALGGARQAAPAPVSAEFTMGVQLLLVLAVGYLFGRQHAGSGR